MHRLAVPNPVASDSPVERVLRRLEKVRRTSGGWMARCPAHDDRFPSLSVGVGRDGRVLVNDFGGCSVDEIVAAIGLDLRDLFVDDVYDFPTPARRAAFGFPREVAQVLLSSDKFAIRWELVKLLARLEPVRAQRDLLRSWDYLETRGIDVPEVWRLARMVRGIAFLSHADPARAHESEEQARAVGRLLRGVI